MTEEFYDHLRNTASCFLCGWMGMKESVAFKDPSANGVEYTSEDGSHK